MPTKHQPTYLLRFFFDYGAGGCLWSGNEATSEKFGVGVLDAPFFDLDGNMTKEAKIKLRDSTRQKVLALDERYYQSLNPDNPTGPSPWDKSQWNEFYVQARVLHQEIADILGTDFEVVYEAEKNDD